MNFRYLLFFIALLPVVSFAEQTVGQSDIQTCSPSFHDDLTILVVDARFRPIENATVLLVYQYSGSFGGAKNGGTYYTVGPLHTNSRGLLNVSVTNVEQTESLLDCVIYMNATVGYTYNETEAIANHHPSVISIVVPVYPVDFFVREQSGQQISGAVVTFLNMTKRTDSTGFTFFYAPLGKADYLVSYMDGKQAGSMSVTGDTSYSLALQPHSIGLEVVDDYGKPLNATLTIINRTVQLGPDGTYSDPKTFGKEIDFTASYLGASKEVKMYPDLDNTTRVVFDFTAPTIGNITRSEVGGKMRFTVPVKDPGVFPSGVDQSSFTVTFRMEPAADATQWSKAVTYVAQKDVFVADFPEFKPNSVVQFKIEIGDVEGNRATVGGKFAILPPPPEPNETQPPPPPVVQEEPGIPIVYIIGGFLLLAVIVYMFLRLKKEG